MQRFSRKLLVLYFFIFFKFKLCIPVSIIHSIETIAFSFVIGKNIFWFVRKEIFLYGLWSKYFLWFERSLATFTFKTKMNYHPSLPTVYDSGNTRIIHRHLPLLHSSPKCRKAIPNQPIVAIAEALTSKDIVVYSAVNGHFKNGSFYIFWQII